MRGLLILLALASSQGLASPLFESDEVLEMTLRGNLSALVADVDERNEHAFALIADGMTLDVDVRVRGNSRVRVCEFPPLRLRFAPGIARGNAFYGQRKLKLVTHCKEAASAEQDVLEEFAAYRIFNLLSDVSFQTRLARISYVDTNRPGESPVVRYAFLIEAETALAERVDGSPVRARRVTKNYLDKSQATLAFVFQFLIGNTDWSFVRPLDSDVCCHNGKLIAIDGRHFYVPYDFDMAGLVNARHARPDPQLRIKRVTQRQYRGYCLDSEVLRDSLETVMSRRSEILDVVLQLPDAATRAAARRSRYLEGFFERASDADALLRRFESRCL